MIKLTQNNFIGCSVFYILLAKIWSVYVHARIIASNWNTQQWETLLSVTLLRFKVLVIIFFSTTAWFRSEKFLKNELYYRKLAAVPSVFIAISLSESLPNEYTPLCSSVKMGPCVMCINVTWRKKLTRQNNKNIGTKLKQIEIIRE